MKIEAVLAPNITDNNFMIVSLNFPCDYDTLTILKCPKSVDICIIYKYLMEYFVSQTLLADVSYNIGHTDFQWTFRNTHQSIQILKPARYCYDGMKGQN